jgi:SOS response regulatory protein OraA/RecX
VDDRRFARLWLQSRLNHRADTPRKLLAGLRSRGIDRDAAAQALKSALHPEAEKALLDRYIAKNRLFEEEPGAADRSSLKFRLKQEGFSPGLIQRFWEDYDL